MTEIPPPQINDDPAELLRYLRTTFITCDSSRMCEQVLKPVLKEIEKENYQKHGGFYENSDSDDVPENLKGDFHRSSIEFLNKAIEEAGEYFNSTTASLASSLNEKSSKEAALEVPQEQINFFVPKSISKRSRNMQNSRRSQHYSETDNTRKIRSETQIRMQEVRNQRDVYIQKRQKHVTPIKKMDEDTVLIKQSQDNRVSSTFINELDIEKTKIIPNAPNLIIPNLPKITDTSDPANNKFAKYAIFKRSFNMSQSQSTSHYGLDYNPNSSVFDSGCSPNERLSPNEISDFCYSGSNEPIAHLQHISEDPANENLIFVRVKFELLERMDSNYHFDHVTTMNHANLHGQDILSSHTSHSDGEECSESFDSDIGPPRNHLVRNKSEQTRSTRGQNRPVRKRNHSAFGALQRSRRLNNFDLNSGTGSDEDIGMTRRTREQDNIITTTVENTTTFSNLSGLLAYLYTSSQEKKIKIKESSELYNFQLFLDQDDDDDYRDLYQETNIKSMAVSKKYLKLYNEYRICDVVSDHEISINLIFREVEVRNDSLAGNSTAVIGKNVLTSKNQKNQKEKSLIRKKRRLSATLAKPINNYSTSRDTQETTSRTRSSIDQKDDKIIIEDRSFVGSSNHHLLKSDTNTNLKKDNIYQLGLISESTTNEDSSKEKVSISKYNSRRMSGFDETRNYNGFKAVFSIS